MVIVTCFEPSDIDESRMNYGAVALAEILADASARRLDEIATPSTDPMLVDLARRLRVRGLRVAVGHRGKLGLVASHGGMCLTIETDSRLMSGSGGQASSLRESLRLRPEMLRRLGWHYLRVHSFELFSNPDAVADRIATILGVSEAPRTEPIRIIDRPLE